jgi:hypothetical protein
MKGHGLGDFSMTNKTKQITLLHLKMVVPSANIGSQHGPNAHDQFNVGLYTH